MAAITRVRGKKGTRFRAQIRLKGGPTLSATFSSRAKAKEWANQTEADVQDGKHFRTPEARRKTLSDLIDRYLAEVNPQRPKSARDRKRLLVWWKTKLGHLLIGDVTPGVIAESRDLLAKGHVTAERLRSPGTTNRYLAALSHAFTFATREWGWAEDNPCRRVSRRREPRGRVRFLSNEERARLLANCRQSPDRRLFPLVVAALATGARRGELLSLRWKDVDFDRKVAVLHDTKNGDRRSLPLSAPAIEALRDLSRLRRIDSDFVFNRESGGPTFPEKAWSTALAESEISDFRFHDLRHTAASYLAMSGATLAEIAEVLGHKTLQMVKRYSHLSEQHVSEVVRRMADKFLG